MEYVDYTKWNVNQLNAKLRKRELPETGLKAVLIHRLEEYDRAVSSKKLNSSPPKRKQYTGVTELDTKILLNLNDRDLFKACQVDIYTANLCNESFWNQRIQFVYGGAKLNKYKGNKTYREIYKELGRESNDSSKLLISAQNGYLPITKYLIENTIIKRGYINLAIEWAAREGRLQTIKYLISKGADVCTL